MPSGSAASILMQTALPPPPLIAFMIFSARVPLRSATTTDAPSSAKRRADAAPMPEPPPVTIATLPSSLLAMGRCRPLSGSAARQNLHYQPTLEIIKGRRGGLSGIKGAGAAARYAGGFLPGAAD